MKNNKGFTLTELIIVVAIIGIIAMIAIPAYIGQQRNATRTEAYTNLEALRLLEEQFFAESGRYTVSLGAAGETTAIRDANITAIQTTAGESLPAFQPGNWTNFSYRIVSGQEITGTDPLAFGANANCFYAIATGVDGTRVDGEQFVIDCNNNRNF
ncbi:MAG: prepilin-type N-terminal cleavage/methylation domain-containing protein [Nitrospiraceae bacterium]|nr:MAG: prepilin-type N-terminal cleavage/methylation domain-containing protein [Nitrospiraceae bacterium]